MISRILTNTLFKEALTPKCLSFQIRYKFQKDNKNFLSKPSIPKQHNELHSIIIELKSLQDFDRLFKQKQKKFDLQCYLIASKTLIQIIKSVTSNDSRTYYKQILKSYLENLEIMPIQTLNTQQFGEILHFLKKIKMLKIFSTDSSWINYTTHSILKKSTHNLKLIKNSINTKQLAYFYKQLFHFNSYWQKIFAQRLNLLISSNEEQKQLVQIQLTQIIDVLRIISDSRNLLNHTQIVLVQSLVKIIRDKHIQKFSILETSQISCYLNELQHKFVNNILSDTIGLINKKLLDNISQINEDCIMLIAGNTYLNNATFEQIYFIAFQKLFQMIDINGFTSINFRLIKRVFVKFANNMKLQMTSRQNQIKFFTLVAKQMIEVKFYAAVIIWLQKLTKLQFFNQSHLKAIVKLMSINIIKQQRPFSIVYEISKRNVDVTNIFDFDKVDSQLFVQVYLIWKIEILNNLIKLNDQNKTTYQSKIILLNQKFINLCVVNGYKQIYKARRFAQNIYKFFNVEIKQKLPNPFTIKSQDKQKISYIFYLALGQQTQQFELSVKNQLNHIRIQNIYQLINFISHQKNPFSERFFTNIFTLFNKNIEKVMISYKHVTFLAKFLYKQINTVDIFKKHKSAILSSKINQFFYNILRLIIHKQTFILFSTIFSFILKQNSRNCCNLDSYAKFCMKLLSFFQIMTGLMIIQLTKQLLRLKLITKQILPKFTPSIRNILPKQVNQKLQKIKDKIIIKKKNLYTKLNLNNYLSDVSKMANIQPIQSLQLEQIETFIQQMNPQQIWQFIKKYKLGPSYPQLAVLQSLFKTLNNKKGIKYQKMNPLEVCEMLFINSIQRSLTNCISVKSYLYNSLQYFKQKNNLNLLNLDDHIKIIELVNFWRIQNQQYIHACFKHKDMQNTYKARYLYLVCASIDFQFNNQELTQLIQKKFYSRNKTGIYISFDILILLDHKINNPQIHLELLMNEYKKKQLHKLTLKIKYQYLKANYLDKIVSSYADNINYCYILCRNLSSLTKYKNGLISAIQQVFGQKFIQQKIFQNSYYRFKNYNFVFCRQIHALLLKKILTKLTQENNFILINCNLQYQKFSLDIFIDNCKDLFTTQKVDKILFKLKNNKK